MSAPSPRLLVALKPRDAIPAAIAQALPGVPWAYLDGSTPTDGSAVEAILVGALGRQYPDFDPATVPRLRFVQRVYTGLDGFPFAKFPRSVAVAGNVGAFAPYVAEQAVALTLAAARALPEAFRLVHDGQLRPAPAQRTLVGATAAVLGFGAIGQEVAHRLSAAGSRIVGVNRTGLPQPGAQEMYPAARLGDALAVADIAVEVRPLTRATRGSIGAGELARMRPEAILVNVGRAATVDEEALYRHLETHPEFRAAFDVWWDEDYGAGELRTRFPFARLPNFLGTPHCAGSVPGAEERALQLALANLARFFHDGQPLFVADRSEYEG